MKFIVPFGPKIAKFKISKSLIKNINTEVDKIYKKKKFVKKIRLFK